jgi:hypothetical protein
MQIESFRLKAHGERFTVHIESDGSSGPPWKNTDIHGPVRSVRDRREKRPGERPLGGDYMYDWQAAVVLALREKWWVAGGQLPGETERAYAARAVQADFDYLRRWLNDEWCYVGVVVTDRHGEEASLWGVEYSGCAKCDEYIGEVARDLAQELRYPRLKAWREALRTARAARVAYAGWMAVNAYATATQPELKASDIAMPSLDGSALPSLDEIDLFDTLSFGQGVPMDKELLEMVLTTPLMTWNHRVVDMSHTNGGDPWFEVREVSYNRQGEATGHASVCLGTEDPASIIALLQRMIDDIRLSPTPIKFDNQETSND